MESKCDYTSIKYGVMARELLDKNPELRKVIENGEDKRMAKGK